MTNPEQSSIPEEFDPTKNPLYGVARMEVVLRGIPDPDGGPGMRAELFGYHIMPPLEPGGTEQLTQTTMEQNFAFLMDFMRTKTVQWAGMERAELERLDNRPMAPEGPRLLGLDGNPLN